MTPDPTEEIRRAMIPEMPAAAAAADRVWTTDEMREDFEAIGFMAPLIVVRRKSDGMRGSLTFSSNPRLYFDFVPDPD